MFYRLATRTVLGLPFWTALGIIGVLVGFTGSVILNVFVLPWDGTADSAAHMDYVYQLHSGTMPEPYGYMWDRPGLPDSSTLTERRQWASAHPPLFYFLASLVAGPFMDSGTWTSAIAATRLLNAFFGGLVIVALAWAGWELGGSRRRIMAVAVPAIGALAGGMNRFAGNEYNDTLVSLFAILTLTLAALILRDGPSRGRLFALIPLAAMGMATKATFVFALLLALTAVPVAHLIHSKARPGGEGTPWRWVARSFAWMAGIIAAVVLTSGWFYARNHGFSGSWFRNTVKAPLLGRTERSMWDVLTDDQFYLVVPRSLLGLRSWDGIWPHNQSVSLALAIVCVVLLIARLATNNRWRLLAAVTPRNLTLAMLLAHLAGHYVAQLQQATGWGAINYRYFQPATLTIVLILAFGLTAWPRFGPTLVSLAIAVLAVGMVLSLGAYLLRAYGHLATTESVWAGMTNALVQNGLPTALLPIAVFCLVCGTLFTAACLFIDRRATTSPSAPISTDGGLSPAESPRGLSRQEM